MKICKALSIALVLGSLAYSASQAAADAPPPSPGAAAAAQAEQNPAALPEGSAPGAPSLTLVGEDGGLKRITNWDELSDAERETAKRRIAERNKERVEALKQAAIKQQQEGAQAATQQQQQEAKAAVGAAGHRKPASSSSSSSSSPVAAAGPGAAAEDGLDEIDLAYRDVYDYKQQTVEERTKLLEKMGDSGKQAFAHRVSKYNNEKMAALTPAEREERRHSANSVMDQVNPELREKLVQLLRDAKGGHVGGATKEEIQKVFSEHKAHGKNTEEDMKRLYRERRERLEVRDPNAPRPGEGSKPDGEGSEPGGSKPDSADCEPNVHGSCDQSEVGAAPGDAGQHDEL